MSHDPLCLCEQCVAHDPLCPSQLAPITSCDCDLIARVREDERGKVYGWLEYQSQRDRDVRAAALRDALAALAAAGHTRYGIYDECECPPEEREREGHLINLMEFSGCEKSLVYWGCRECCTDDGYHSEACATYHEHGEGKSWCSAVAAVQALVGER